MRGGTKMKRMNRGILIALLLVVGCAATVYAAAPPDQILGDATAETRALLDSTAKTVDQTSKPDR